MRRKRTTLVVLAVIELLVGPALVAASGVPDSINGLGVGITLGAVVLLFIAAVA